MRCRKIVSVAVAGMLLIKPVVSGMDNSDSVDRFNYVVGTQTIGSKYQFTDKPRLVDTAEVIRGMGSNILKFQMGPGFEKNNYSGSSARHYTSLMRLAQDDSAIRAVLEMPFYYYFMWVSPMARCSWTDDDGYTAKDARTEYKEIYDLTCYLLKTYNGTGKSFYIGHWEGDWLLLGSFDPTDNPDPRSVREMIKWLNNRQKAVDDAKRDTPGSDVKVFHYTEVNQVIKGLRGLPCLASEVLPNTSVDFVSYSAYDAMFEEKIPNALEQALDFIQQKIPPKEGLSGSRVFIGEFGCKASGYTPAQQRDLSIRFMREALKWGCPFILQWQLYDNELSGGKYQGYWLINNEGRKQPLYYALENYYSEARAYVQSQLKETGSVPAPETFRLKAGDFIKSGGRGEYPFD